ENIEIVFTINSKKVYIDGVEQELDVSTEVTNGRTYVPLRFIAETFGLTVNWDDENGTIDIEDQTDIEDEPEIEDESVIEE
ncbi:MAG: copper amine oxidase N-terminal domain-containing protein, partial [Eubacteriales bacterium]|nr:copper amine oxidase N-terminal domain-containing protein [Eubacteriales bacterium]